MKSQFKINVILVIGNVIAYSPEETLYRIKIVTLKTES